jgi:hypothetical protein
MGSVSLKLIAALALGLLVASPAFAAPPPAKAPAKAKASKKRETREGSYIVNNMPMPPPPDLRGTYEKARDDELMVHYQRLARLDYIEDLATQQKDNRLLERVENVRRKETQRHRAAMTAFSEQARARAMVGF